MKTTQTRP